MPRVLRLRHDLPNPENGFSPYQLVFGRERPLGGLPQSIPRANPDAEEFLEGIKAIDDFALEILRKELQKQEREVNKRRPFTLGMDFKVGDWVFMQRPTAYAGPKMQTSWLGPYQIESRVGEHSFRLKVAPHTQQEVHVDQLKSCFSIPNFGRNYPLVYRKGEPLVSTPESCIKMVLRASITEEDVQFLVEWTEVAGGGRGWISAQQMGPAWSEAFKLVAVTPDSREGMERIHPSGCIHKGIKIQQDPGGGDTALTYLSVSSILSVLGLGAALFVLFLRRRRWEAEAYKQEEEPHEQSEPSTPKRARKEHNPNTPPENKDINKLMEEIRKRQREEGPPSP